MAQSAILGKLSFGPKTGYSPCAQCAHFGRFQNYIQIGPSVFLRFCVRTCGPIRPFNWHRPVFWKIYILATKRAIAHVPNVPKIAQKKENYQKNSDNFKISHKITKNEKKKKKKKKKVEKKKFEKKKMKKKFKNFFSRFFFNIF